MELNFIKSLAFFSVFLGLCLVSCSNLVDSRNDGDDTPHVILYDANESTSGSVPVDSNTYEPGKIVTVLGNTGGLAKTGYLFKGWTLSASGNGVLYPAGSAFLMGRKNLTLYAKWALPPGGAVWARAASGSDVSMFSSVAADSVGNVYAAGSQIGNGAYSYGTGVASTGGYAEGENAVVVKYDSSGSALWAKTPSGSYWSSFSSVAPDPSGNVYAAGSQIGNGAYTYGTGVAAAGTHSGQNAVVVKYDSSGNALWATVPSGNDDAGFGPLASDSAGNLYAAGSQRGTGTFTYGTGVSATGFIAAGSNAVLVKYDSSGNALWARTPSGTATQPMFSAVAVDSGGNVYVAGYQNGTGTATYGAGVSAAGASAGDHSILVKYDSSGTALWARIVSGTGNARFSGIATDSGGNVYAAGFQAGTGTATYGTGVSATGSSSGGNAVVVKYDPSGNALWAKVASGSGDSSFNSVATDSAGNLYAAGYQNGTGTCTYGTGVAAAGAYAGGGNAVAVKYDSSGNALWASTPSSSSMDTIFSAVTPCPYGYVVTAGYQYGNTEVVYGIQASATGAYSGGSNAVIVKYMH